jgi:predicted ArsR family transcriptional regulator
MFQHRPRTRSKVMLQHAREIAPSVSWEILALVKRSGGMCVKELSAKLKMSYMGVKQHCDDLKRRGYVDTWRRAKKTGRPEKIYRPAEKLDLVLPNWSSELCLGLLSLVAQAYGDTVPERLLYSFLQQKVERWNGKLKGKKPSERAHELAKLRVADGWMCEVIDDAAGLRIVDHHSPLAEVVRLYPSVADMEVRVLSRIFGQTLQRRADGCHVEFIIIAAEPAAAPPPPPPADETDEVPSPRHNPTPVSRPTKIAKSPRPAVRDVREGHDLELIGTPDSPRSHHQADLFEL